MTPAGAFVRRRRPLFTKLPYSLAVLRDCVPRDGGRLLVVGCHNLGVSFADKSWGRALLRRHWLDVIEPMCERLGLPFLDLHADFANVASSTRSRSAATIIGTRPGTRALPPRSTRSCRPTRNCWMAAEET